MYKSSLLLLFNHLCIHPPQKIKYLLFKLVIFSSTVNITKGDSYNLVRPWLGNGLLTSTGKKWFHDRKLITPAFHFSILNKFAVIQSEQAEILTKNLEKELAKNIGKPVDTLPFITNTTLAIICETAMGVNIHAQDSVMQYSEKLNETSHLVLKRFYKPWYTYDWLYYLLPEGKKFKSAVETLHAFTQKVIRKKKAERHLQRDHAQFENEDNDFSPDKPKRKAFLDLLLDQNMKDDTPLTDEELRAQVDTVMFAGHDTTSIGITWTLFLLGNNPEYQEKVHEELKEVFGDSESPASIKEISELKYLERVFKETLRMFPSVPIVSRKLSEDVKLGNCIIPKDTAILCSILLMQRNPKIWPDPMKFDPDRFLPENSKLRNPYAYIPFSAGPRNCIGQKFAILEAKIILCAILRKWRVKSVKTLDTIKYGCSIILRPTEKVLIHFTPKK
ncbi:hypothetical protein PUN28_000481 [Cardiocondyla obscurior]|uniref:Cytochrome P450 n=1 Tax=Cardiocondyla obscurior TaxID=286306 RepID=A0AAW2GZR9_9HYME